MIDKIKNIDSETVKKASKAAVTEGAEIVIDTVKTGILTTISAILWKIGIAIFLFTAIITAGCVGVNVITDSVKESTK